MATPQIEAVPPVQPTFAGLGRRFAALLLDTLITFSVVIMVGVTFRVFRATGMWAPTGANVDPATEWHALSMGPKSMIFLAYVIASGAIYYGVMEASAWQATFGKRALKIYVTGADGARIHTLRAEGRWFCKWFLGWFAGSLVSLITVAVTPQRRALHDYIAGTVVRDGVPSSAPSLEPWRVLAAIAIPYLWMLATFLAIF